MIFHSSGPRAYSHERRILKRIGFGAVIVGSTILLGSGAWARYSLVGSGLRGHRPGVQGKECRSGGHMLLCGSVLESAALLAIVLGIENARPTSEEVIRSLFILLPCDLEMKVRSSHKTLPGAGPLTLSYERIGRITRTQTYIRQLATHMLMIMCPRY